MHALGLPDIHCTPVWAVYGNCIAETIQETGITNLIKGCFKNLEGVVRGGLLYRFELFNVNVRLIKCILRVHIR